MKKTIIIFLLLVSINSFGQKPLGFFSGDNIYNSPIMSGESNFGLRWETHFKVGNYQDTCINGWAYTIVDGKLINKKCRCETGTGYNETLQEYHFPLPPQIRIRECYILDSTGEFKKAYKKQIDLIKPIYL